MPAHLTLPGVALKPGFVHAELKGYLREWRESAISAADSGDTAASICLQGILIDLVLEGQIRHDWLTVMDELLTKGEYPIAYSEEYCKHLHNFGSQYLQSTIHSIHTRWWLETLVDGENTDHDFFAKLVLAKKQPNGLIYDADVSATVLRHRMKVELAMSAAMGAEILNAAGRLDSMMRDELSHSLCDPRKVPPIGYLTCEQFRLAALRIMDREVLFPVGIEEHIDACTAGLENGWNDFSITAKIDAYMGTAKRTSRDRAIHSPLIACHVAALSTKVSDPGKRVAIGKRLSDYARALALNPRAIPSFQMRDVTIPFGANITPIEAVCASHLITNLCTKEDL